jgi:hypothetical protein
MKLFDCESRAQWPMEKHVCIFFHNHIWWKSTSENNNGKNECCFLFSLLSQTDIRLPERLCNKFIVTFVKIDFFSAVSKVGRSEEKKKKIYAKK